jgi:exodeoxyribonuclease V alpha subunit
MVDLALMSRLVDALQPETRLILLGDRDQLASVEAGAVLGDIAGPTAGGLRIGADARRRLGTATGAVVAASDPPAGARAGIGDGIVVLDPRELIIDVNRAGVEILGTTQAQAIVQPLDEARARYHAGPHRWNIELGLQ